MSKYYFTDLILWVCLAIAFTTAVIISPNEESNCLAWDEYEDRCVVWRATP